MTDRAPLAVDLCCGLGGWTEGLLAEGWRVIGFDLVRPRAFPAGADFIKQDVRTIDGRVMRGRVALIVASPPCTEFSQVWSFAKHRTPRPELGVELVEHCYRIADEAGAPLVLENVAGAQKHIGAAAAHVGPFYLWGAVPLLLPYGRFRKGIWNTNRRRDGSRRWNDGDGWRARTYQRDPAERSKIPIEIARAVGRQLHPCPI